MSYVLDALRRAESERQRGQVPHLHAPAGADMATPPEVGAASRPGARAAAWTMLALVLAAVATGAWWWFSPASPPSAAATATPDALALPAAESNARSVVAPTARAAVAVPPPVALPEPVPVRRSTTAAPAVAPPRPAMPAMSFGGAFDSPDPRARMLIINGQVWREGDEPVPGWVLERIGLHQARFSVQGRAVEVDYAAGPGR